MVWVWVALGIIGVILCGAAAFMVWLYFHLKRNFLNHLIRIFQEQPLFIIPKGKPSEAAEDVQFQNEDGMTLRACYFNTPAPQRRGVIVFGLEFGSNRWACLPYCEFLLKAGFDIFAFEPRNQGESDCQEGYSSLQWATNLDIQDWRAALAYLRNRDDAPEHVGAFGLSKGGTLALLVGADEPFIKCFVTDGAFATLGTMIPYMQKWIRIYSQRYWLQDVVPLWYYRLFAYMGMDRIAKKMKCTFPHLEDDLKRISPRPWLQIHGQSDNYIRPEMAEKLHHLALPPKELWMVPKAKHNQALNVAREEYQRRVLDFFTTHLATARTTPKLVSESRNGAPHMKPASRSQRVVKQT